MQNIIILHCKKCMQLLFSQKGNIYKVAISICKAVRNICLIISVKRLDRSVAIVAYRSTLPKYFFYFFLFVNFYCFFIYFFLMEWHVNLVHISGVNLDKHGDTNLNNKSWYIRAPLAPVPYMKVLTLLNGTVQTMHR